MDLNHSCPATNIRTPVGDCTPFTDAWMGTAPVGTLAGSWTAIWYNPALSGLITALRTVTGTPPTVMAGRVATLDAATTSIPAGVAGLVGPKLVARRISMSSGLEKIRRRFPPERSYRYSPMAGCRLASG